MAGIILNTSWNLIFAEGFILNNKMLNKLGALMSFAAAAASANPTSSLSAVTFYMLGQWSPKLTDCDSGGDTHKQPTQ